MCIRDSRNTDPFSARCLIEPYGREFVVQNPPQPPLSTQEMDDVYALPYQDTYHPDVYKRQAMEIPEGYVGLVFARSGLASRRDLAPANKVGVVDSDYRGEFFVPMHNHGCLLYTSCRQAGHRGIAHDEVAHRAGCLLYTSATGAAAGGLTGYERAPFSNLM